MTKFRSKFFFWEILMDNFSFKKINKALVFPLLSVFLAARAINTRSRSRFAQKMHRQAACTRKIGVRYFFETKI